jgi:hypothetical protein
MSTTENANGKVRVENTERDQKILLLDKNDKSKSIILGSRDDAKNPVVGVPRPEVLIDLATWKKLEARKAIQGWMQSGAIRVHAA